MAADCNLIAWLHANANAKLNANENSAVCGGPIFQIYYGVFFPIPQ